MAYTTLRANGQLKNNVGEKETAKTCIETRVTTNSNSL